MIQVTIELPDDFDRFMKTRNPAKIFPHIDNDARRAFITGIIARFLKANGEGELGNQLQKDLLMRALES